LAVSSSGATLELSPSSDAFIRASQSAAATSNESNWILIVGDTATEGDYLRGVLSFDTEHSALVGTTINHVELVLRVSDRDTSNGGSLDQTVALDLHSLTNEYLEAEVDWFFRRDSVSWETPGGDYGDLLDRVQVNPATVDEGATITFRSPYLTSDFIDSIGGDYHLLLKLASEDRLRSVLRFFSRSADFDLRPVLLIDYTPNANVVPVPGHLERPVSSRYSVTAGGRPIEVKAERFSFDVAMLSMGTGPVGIDIECSTDFTSFSLKPDRHGLTVSRQGNRLHFQIDEPKNLVLQIPGRTPLAILVTPLESDLPLPSDPDVLYFWPGVHDVGIIRPQSGQTIYLAPGSLVKGRIEAKGVQGVRIRGRGILETAGYSVRSESNAGILFEDCEEITVEGIGLRSFYTWWQTLYLNCVDVEVAHMNLFGLGVNTDGVDIDAVKNFVVRDSFIRAEDDGLGWHSLDAAANGEMITENALAENLVIWNTGAGNGIRIGASMEAQLWRNITICNVDILQHAGAGIYSDYSDWAWMENLRFENIVIEKPSRPIDFYIGTTIYSNSTGYLDERGHIDGVVFENVKMNGGLIRFVGYDATHRINNLRFINCVNQGDPVNSLSDISVNAFVTDLGFDQTLTPYPTLDPGSYVLADLESTIDGGVQYIEDYPSALKGRRRVFIGGAIGDSIEQTFSVTESGSYRLKLGVWCAPESPQIHVYLDDALLGMEDLSQSTEIEKSLDLGIQILTEGGTHRLRIEVIGSQVGNSGYPVYLDELKVLSPLQAWRDDYFGSSMNAGDGSHEKDPDGDGVANLFEYMAGSHPVQTNDFALLSPASDRDYRYEWKHPIPALLDCRIEVSSDLSAWDTIASITHGSDEWTLDSVGAVKWPDLDLETDLLEGGSEIGVRLDVMSEFGPGRLFFRLRVAEP
tara:strand:+ start:1428 stop:4181 length:2754 start_codon:yes stop_codon:yes gene_type:complete